MATCINLGEGALLVRPGADALLPVMCLHWQRGVFNVTVCTSWVDPLSSKNPIK